MENEINFYDIDPVNATAEELDHVFKLFYGKGTPGRKVVDDLDKTRKALWRFEHPQEKEDMYEKRLDFDLLNQGGCSDE